MQPYPKTVTANGSTAKQNNSTPVLNDDSMLKSDDSEIKNTTNIRLGYDEPVYAIINKNNRYVTNKLNSQKMGLSSIKHEGYV